MNNKTRKNIALAIVQNKFGKVLIIKRAHTEDMHKNSKLTWAFPGGEYVQGEDPIEELIKEVKEETGYDIEVLEKISEREIDLPFVHLSYFNCRVSSPNIQIVEETQEIETVKWVDKTKLTKFFTSDIDKGVKKFLEI